MKKNILLITSDQQHWDTLGRFHSLVKTPNLDRLMADGLCFNRAYTVNPTCTPTRATLLTGLMPSQHGAWTLGTKLQENVHCITEDFKKSGYKTALVGKAHFQPLASSEEYPSLEAYPLLQDLDFWRNYAGDFYGFDQVELARNHTNEAHVGQHYALWLEEKGCKNWRDYFLAPTGTMEKSNETTWAIPEEYHYNTWIAEKTNQLLEEYQNNQENFFLWSSFFDPHPDYLVPEPWASMYDPAQVTLPEISQEEEGELSPFLQLTRQEKPDASPYRKSGFALHGVHSHRHDDQLLRKQIATYYGMVSMLDCYIGKILDQLDRLGLADSTTVVFTSDHGHFFGQHGLVAKGPFLFEDLVKVPLVVRDPDCQKKGGVSSSLQSILDIPATLLDLCQIPRPDGMAGRSQKNIWTGQTKTDRTGVICEDHHEKNGVHLNAFVTDRYKIVIYQGSNFGELYDLQEDPGENRNLWHHPQYESVKSQLFFAYLQTQMEFLPEFMPRIAHA